METKKAKYLQKWASMDQIYSPAQVLHKNVTDYILPTFGSYFDRGDPAQTPNVNRFEKIINDAGSRANQILGAGMMDLCSPSRPWFQLTLTDRDLAEFGPVKDWLQECEQVLYKLFGNSNFYTEANNIFESQGGFGTGVLMQTDGMNSVFDFRCFDVGEYRIATGPQNRVDTCYRRFFRTAKQLADMFGVDALSNSTKQMLEKTPYNYVEVLHVLEPRGNDERDYNKIDNSNMPYKSCWLEINGPDDKILRESGFEEIPFTAPRWRQVGQYPYGIGPGMFAMGNVMMLQEMEKTGLIALHKEIDPPVWAPGKFKDIVNLLPGAVNYGEGDGKEKIESLYNVSMNLQNLEYKLKEVESRIERTFFNDLFMMIINSDRSGREMTATEVMRRQEEKMLLLGPTIERQINELLDPVIERSFNLAYKKGLFPPAPPEVEGQEWEVEYISTLARSQKLANAQSMTTYLGEVERVAQLDEHSLIKTNFEEYLQQYADIIGVPVKVLRTQDEFEKILENQVQAEQQAQQMAQMQAMVAGAKDLGQASTEEGTALGDLKASLE